MKADIVVFTDGSSRGNPGKGGWGSIVFFQNKDVPHVRELGGRDNHTTNNRMELTAAHKALEFVYTHAPKESVSVQVYTDSKYLIQGITQWVFGWEKNNWITSQKTAVENRDLWEGLLSLTRGKNIVWTHVDGHAGVPGNERCDGIATSYADENPVSLYDGDASLYSVDLSVVSGASEGGVKKRKSAQAYSYVSVVDGVFKTHTTWASCEKEVKGKKGARFKKAVSAEDEKNIQKEWGI